MENRTKSGRAELMAQPKKHPSPQKQAKNLSLIPSLTDLELKKGLRTNDTSGGDFCTYTACSQLSCP